MEFLLTQRVHSMIGGSNYLMSPPSNQEQHIISLSPEHKNKSFFPNIIFRYLFAFISSVINSKHLLRWVIFIQTILIVIPLMITLQTHLSNSIFENNLKSSEAKTAALASIAFTIPLAMELVMDYFFGSPALFPFHHSNAIMIFLLDIPAVLILSNVNHIATLFVASLYLLFITIFGVKLIILAEVTPTVYTFWRVILVFSIFSVGNIFSILNLQNNDNSFAFAMATAISQYITIASLIILFVLICYNIYLHYMTTEDSLLKYLYKMPAGNIISSSFSFSLIILAISNFILVITTGTSATWEDTNTSYISGCFIFKSFFVLVVATIPSRLNKFRALSLMVDLDRKTNFVRYIGHEIRNPLSIVLLSLELLEADLVKSNASAETLSTVAISRESCQNGLEVLNELLLFDKLEGGLQQLELTEQDPVLFVKKYATPFTLVANKKDIVLEILLTDTTILQNKSISIDESKMGLVLRNFLSNAMKFTPAGGKVQVLFSYVESDNWVRLTVKDTGYGISPENHHKVFKEIVQFNANAQQGGGGSGFGLWICSKIVSLHGYRIGFDSVGDGLGCTFYVEMPLNDVVMAPITLPLITTPIRPNPVTRAPSILQKMSKTYTIMVVDDSELNRKIACRVLKALGHICYEAANGVDCINLYKNLLEEDINLDTILMDNNMPEMNGEDCTRVLRSLDFMGFIIGVTGDAMAADVEQFMSSGLDDIIIKPMSSTSFSNCMEKIELLVASGELDRLNSRPRMLKPSPQISNTWKILVDGGSFH